MLPSSSPEPEDVIGAKDPPPRDAVSGLVERGVRINPTELGARSDNDADNDNNDDDDDSSEN